MAKYSSDSDSDRSNRYRKKHYRRSRSASSSSSEDSSSYQKKKTTTTTTASKRSKSKRKHRSRSRSRDKERTTRFYKSSRVSSRELDVKRRYQQHNRKSKSSSTDRDKKNKLRSVSRDKSSSRSSSSQSNVKTFVGIDKGQNSSNKCDDFNVEIKTVKDQSIIDEINSDRFVPKNFTSSSSQNKQFNKTNNIVIDITADTIKIPAVVNVTDNSESIFHTSITSDNDARFDKWVKKLYTLRQKAITDLINNGNSMS